MKRSNPWKSTRYRTCANKGRSRLVAAPLTFQAKNRFLWLFHVVIWGLKTQFSNSVCGLYWRGYGRSNQFAMLHIFLRICFWKIKKKFPRYSMYTVLNVCRSNSANSIFTRIVINSLIGVFKRDGLWDWLYLFSREVVYEIGCIRSCWFL